MYCGKKHNYNITLEQNLGLRGDERKFIETLKFANFFHPQAYNCKKGGKMLISVFQTFPSRFINFKRKKVVKWKKSANMYT